MKNDLLPLLRIDGESSATLGHQEHVIGRTPLVCDDRVGGEMAQSGCRQNHLVIKRRKSSRNLDLESAARVAGFERGIREWFQESWLPITALQDHDSIRSMELHRKRLGDKLVVLTGKLTAGTTSYAWLRGGKY